MSSGVKLALKDGESFKYHEHSNGLKYLRHDYFAPEVDPEFSPQSYLIKQLPKVVNPLHFHEQNQFQVFIEGQGSFGKHLIEPYVVHYAGAYTGYGPIVAGEEGLHYLTLRSSRDPGAKFLPAQMDLFKKGPKHHYTSPSMKALDHTDLNALKEVDFRWEHMDQNSGLGVGELKLPPHQAYDIRIPNQAAGIFIVVMQGCLVANEQKMFKNENLYIAKKTESYSIRTDEQAVQVLVLQMPLKNPAYSHTPP